MVSASVIFLPKVATADPVGSLQQQAAQLSSEMLLEQLQIGADLHQRETDLVGVSKDTATVTALGHAITGERHAIKLSSVTLRKDAVTAYVIGGTRSNGAAPPFSVAPSAGANDVYREVMVGDIPVTIHRLRAQEHVLSAEMAAVEGATAKAQHALGDASVVLGQARAAEQSLRAQKASVTAQLSAAITRQQAQEAAANAALAARTSPPASTSSSSAPPTPAASSSVSATTTAGGSGGLPPLPAFLSCVMQHESGGDFQAVSPTGLYRGAFQFVQGTWDEAARLAGLPSLVGVLPDTASPRDQCLLAIALYGADGEQPWYDPCAW